MRFDENSMTSWRQYYVRIVGQFIRGLFRKCFCAEAALVQEDDGTINPVDYGSPVHVLNISSTGVAAMTLLDGIEGQILHINCLAATGAITLTPSNFENGTSMTFNAKHDYAQLYFHDSSWWYQNGVSVTINP